VLVPFALFFRRQSLVWLAVAGGFWIVTADAMGTLSLLVLRRRAPEMPRPYQYHTSWVEKLGPSAR
jgi:APA family basic amino acid/polyamine antiporter